jgi:hypothetical protein
MSLLLRIITKPKWVRPDWIAPGDIPADALSDLRATNNELSVWSIELDQSNLNVVLVAAAANRDRLDKLDYTVFDEQLLPALEIKCAKSEGRTPYSSANIAMHRDLVELTVQKVASLAQVMMPLDHIRVTERQIRRMLLDAIQAGVLDRARILPKLLNDLEHQFS